MTKPKRAHVGQKAKLTTDQIWHLCKGYCLYDRVSPNYRKLGPNDFPMPFRSWEHRKKVYFSFKNEIFALQGQNIPDSHVLAFAHGARPAAWWQFEAPEPRRLISGNKDFILNRDSYFFGLPNYYTNAADHGTLVFESQAEYLTRLGLLLPGELEKVKPELIRV